MCEIWAVSCSGHTKTERLENTPVCTGCAFTERFAWKTKYFYDEENLEAFCEEYEAMPLHRKAIENLYLVVGVVGIVLLLASGVLAYVGIV